MKFLQSCSPTLCLLAALLNFADPGIAEANDSSEMASYSNGAASDAIDGVDIQILKWAESMHSIPAPHSGCFGATFPSLIWYENQCVEAPNVPHMLKPQASQAAIIGGGGGNADVMATSAQLVQRVDGAIPYFKNYTSVSDSTYGANNFSVQINTNTFPHSLCNGATNPNTCSAWQQFVFWNGTSGNPFFSGIGIQYWLINYGYKNNCPTGGWARDGNVANPGPNCFRTTQGQSYTTTNPNILKGLVMSAQATSGGNDKLTLWSPIIPNSLTMITSDSVLGLGSVWKQTQFNIFGFGNSSQAAFNSGAGLSTQITSYDGSSNALPTSCTPGDFTGETNNLSFVGACCPGAPNSGYQSMVNTEGLNSSITAPFCPVTEVLPFP